MAGINCSAAGRTGCGTVYKITPGGTLTTLYRFDSTDGSVVSGGLVQAANGNFYGTASAGGANMQCTDGVGCGTVFEITPKGKLTTLYSFCVQQNCPDGYDPQAGLIQSSDGNFYGTTVQGGAYNAGTIFKITPAGKLTTLYSFCAQSNCSDGSLPYEALVLATDGNFYSTTAFGGAFKGGTVFKVTAAGRLTTLYSFCAQSNCPDGVVPYGGLAQATDGNFYGTTFEGGAHCPLSGACGTVFKITPTGKLTTLHSFDNTDGAALNGNLLQATSGNFYGTTPGGGDLGCNTSRGCGTVFRISVGLGPFVETRPTSGKVGAKVIIAGNSLTGATGVTFNGTAAMFKVVSSSEITTMVPAGATTGTVEVTTLKKTLKSNLIFRVTK